MSLNYFLPELFCSQHLLCGEGPLLDPVREMLFWTDCGAEAVYEKGLNDSTETLVFQGIHVSSLALHVNGGLVFGSKEGFFHRSSAGTIRSFHSAEATVKDINDIIADPAGRVFGGQESFREDGNYSPGYLFRLDPDGSCRIVEEGLHLANGMGFSPELDRFYLVDSIPRTIYEYGYNKETGVLSNRRTLVTLDRNEGLPDGLTVDSEGFIWVARWFGGGLSRYDPEGKLERTVRVPVTQTSSLTFGGSDYREMFITTAAMEWKSPLAPENHDFTARRGGGVYRIRSDIQGKAEFLARI